MIKCDNCKHVMSGPFEIELCNIVTVDSYQYEYAKLPWYSRLEYQVRNIRACKKANESGQCQNYEYHGKWITFKKWVLRKLQEFR